MRDWSEKNEGSQRPDRITMEWIRPFCSTSVSKIHKCAANTLLELAEFLSRIVETGDILKNYLDYNAMSLKMSIKFM